MQRRTVLATAASVLSIVVAGCLGSDDPTPQEEVVIEFYEFEAEAQDLEFDERVERVEALFHSDSPTSEYDQYRREDYDVPYVQLADVETEIVEEDLGEATLRESRYFDDATEDLLSAFAGENAVVEIDAEYESERDIDVSSENVAFVVRADGEWRIFSWGLP